MSQFAQLLLPTHDEVFIDNFAGGGGASLGYEIATGRHVDVAINHDADALELHKANHQTTIHLRSDVYDVNPRQVQQSLGGRPIGGAWFSPDCTGFSRAKGSRPEREATKKRRSLAWVVAMWAGTVRPRVIYLENVMEFTFWTRLVGPKDNLQECKKTKGRRFKRLVRILRDMGYAVEWRTLRACDYGAATIRKRLFLVARCDGKSIVWPEPTHGDPESDHVKRGLLKPWDVTANHIDWSLPMLSIFASRAEAKAFAKTHGVGIPQRPLKPNTHGRVGRGVKRFVLDAAKPYIKRVPWSTIGRDDPHVAPFTTGVGGRAGQIEDRPLTVPLQTVTAKADTSLTSAVVIPVTHAGDRPGWSAGSPLPTVTCAQRGELAIIVPFLVPRYGERKGQAPRCRSVQRPHPTIVLTDNGGSLFAAHATTYYGGDQGGDRGCELGAPLPTIPTENRHGLVALHIGTMRNAEKPFASPAEPSHTITSGGAGLYIVAAHLASYYGSNLGAEPSGSVTAPIATVTPKDRHSLVATLLATNNDGFAKGNSGDGRPVTDPAATLTNKGANHALLAVTLDNAHNGWENRAGRKVDDPLATIVENGRGHSGLVGVNLAELHGTATAEDVEEPLGTISAKGQHHALVATHVQRDFGQSVGSRIEEPLGTVTAGSNGHAALVASFLEEHAGVKPGRFGLTWLTYQRKRYVVADILMRMLYPHELAGCQGFPKGYILDRGADGRRFTKSKQVGFIGNSVSPPVAAALIRANQPEMIARPAKEMAHA